MDKRKLCRVTDRRGDERNRGRYLMDYSRQYGEPYRVEDKAREHMAKRRTIMLKTGIKGHQEAVVTQEMTAKNVGSGVMDVLATPSMLALMEKTAFMSVSEYLNPGCGTVGTSVNIQHTASTPVGMKITCNSELVEVEGRKLIFSVEAFDEVGPIGKGIHERFIVENEKFQQKTDNKFNKVSE